MKTLLDSPQSMGKLCQKCQKPPILLCAPAPPSASPLKVDAEGMLGECALLPYAALRHNRGINTWSNKNLVARREEGQAPLPQTRGWFWTAEGRREKGSP